MNVGRTVALLAGFALDALLGDPQGWPHPVRLIGKQIEFEERLVRDYVLVETVKLAETAEADEAGEKPEVDNAAIERLCGAAIAVDVALATPIASAAVLRLCRKAHPALGVAAEAILFYQLIAARSLRNESMAVHGKLSEGDLAGARQAVSMIVGRDTDRLDEEGVARATVETVAENASDGGIAPLVYMAIGGVPAAMMYKAVNTLDSMMGYKNDRYINLGWAGAKLDDVLNIVPARLTGVLMCAAAKVCGYDAAGAWRIFKRDRYNHASPNSAHAEAACAGALGVRLGGASSYFGRVVEKPVIGDATRALSADDIVRANKLMYATAVLGLGGAAIAALLAKR